MSLNKKIVDLTRNLRRLQTPEEVQLWEKLRNRKLNGLKFLRQHPIVYGSKEFTPLFFVADFYCADKKLVIELDGKIHEFQKEDDENRDSILNQLGLRVLRIKNEELINLGTVLKKIVTFSTYPPSPSLLSKEGVSDPDLSGEDGGELAILILAAGSSFRMGQSKQLLEVESKPLLRKIAEQAIAIEQSNVFVVLGANASQHAEVLKDLPMSIVINEDWQNGMGSSLKEGVKFVQTNMPACKGVLVVVCDQPFLTSDHLKKLIAHFYSSNKPIVASAYSNTTGVPCLFSRNYFSELLNLKDAEGAKKILQLFPDHVETVDFPHGEIDVDTPDDYGRLKILLAGKASA